MVQGSETPGLLHIGAVAERTELSLRTLRHYDEIGLVVPSARTGGGFRLYSEADVERILLIRRMKPLDFTLEQMRELLDAADAASAADPAPAALDTVRGIAAIARERRERLEHRVAMADEFLALLDRLATPRTDRGHPTGTE